MKKTVLILCALFCAMGCSRGPNTKEIQNTLQGKLDEQFQKGLFKIESFSRRGSYPYKDAKDKSEKRLIYYKAYIKMEKDHKFSNWDGLNIGSLLSILGSTRLGVIGIKTEGNKKGDELLVHGTIAYALKDGKWLEEDYNPALHSTKSKTRHGKHVVEMDENSDRQLNDIPKYLQHIETIKKIGMEFGKKKELENIKFLEKKLKETLETSYFTCCKNSQLDHACNGFFRR